MPSPWRQRTSSTPLGSRPTSASRYTLNASAGVVCLAVTASLMDILLCVVGPRQVLLHPPPEGDRETDGARRHVQGSPAGASAASRAAGPLPCRARRRCSRALPGRSPRPPYELAVGGGHASSR